MAKAAGHGLAVLKPWGDSLRYDFVVETEGGFLRVQVKSTFNHRIKGGYMCHVQPPPHTPRYSARDVDFLALYVIPEDVWYIVPSPVLTRMKGSILLSPASPGHKYESYLEAWHLLRGTRSGRRLRRKMGRARLPKCPRRAQCGPKP
jgi:hypothetical protein